MSLSRRTSIREIFRSKSRPNLVDDNPAPPPTAAPRAGRAAYVPVNAASGFSKTFRPPRTYQTYQTSLPITKEETATSFSRTSTSNDIDDHDEDLQARELVLQRARISRMLIQPGHLFLDIPSQETTLFDTQQDPPPRDDFQAFVASTKAQEEARLYLSSPVEKPPHLSPLRRQRDSGYSSSSLSPLREMSSTSSSSSPSSPAALRHLVAPQIGREEDSAASKTLRKRQSLRLVGQRIADYVRPADVGPLSAR